MLLAALVLAVIGLVLLVVVPGAHLVGLVVLIVAGCLLVVALLTGGGVGWRR